MSAEFATQRGGIEVRQLTTIDELEDLRLAWRDLLGRTPRATFFHSLDWLAVYWRHFGHDQRLRVLVVSDRLRTLGILPLVVRPTQTRAGLLRTLSFPLDYWGSFYGPLGNQLSVTLAAGLAYIRDQPFDWDLIELAWLHPDGEATRTSTALDFVGLPAVAAPHAPVAVIELRDAWADYWRQRGKHFRRGVERAGRRLSQQGRVRFVRHRPGGAALGDVDPRWDLFEHCLEVTRRSWQYDTHDGVSMAHPAAEPFLRDLHEAATEQGALDVSLLYLDGAPVAFAYGYHYHGYLSIIRIGYDRRVREGAGLALVRRVIESSFEMADHTIDLGPDYIEHKRRWATRLIESARVTHYPWRPRPQVLRCARWLRTQWRHWQAEAAGPSSNAAAAPNTPFDPAPATETSQRYM